jgi:Flp pilus assembly protein TadG
MKIRKQQGQLAFYASALIALIVLILGLFAYEVSEYCLAREQLQTAVEASALACETTLASSGVASSQDSQNNAFSAATHVFQLNSILGKSLAHVTLRQRLLAKPLFPSKC